MDANLAVRASGVGKQYQLGQLGTGYKLLTEVVTDRIRGGLRPKAQPREEFWALRDIDFELKRGETFGIIGHNGAGKSTLLKVLSRVTPPTEGEIRLRGRVGALLEVGTGFHAELTGRENIYLNGAILGLRRAEIESKFDEIVEFAEVEQFIDTPVKRYSSGMYLRLAFAVAAHLEPDILIVDEVLSVGDLAFQEKCLGRMDQVAGEGRTVIFVSHNLTAVQRLCPRSMLLARGRKVTEGPTRGVVEEYIASVRKDAATELGKRTDRDGSGRLRFEHVGFRSNGQTTDMPVTGEPTEIVIGYSSPSGREVRDPTFSISIFTGLGELILQLQSDASTRYESLPPEGEIVCRLDRLPLPAGTYTINLFSSIGGEIADWIQRAAQLTVAEGDFFGTGRTLAESHQTVLVDQEWRTGELSRTFPAAP